MVKTSAKVQRTIHIPVKVKQDDIEGGIPCKASLCMHKVAIARTLDTIHHEDHRVRVDAGHIKFNLDGYRWEAKTPRIARATLIKFDDPKLRETVKPHEYTIEAVRTTKITKMSPERQDQINTARRSRVARKGPDRKYTLRDRIIGYDLGHGA